MRSQISALRKELANQEGLAAMNAPTLVVVPVILAGGSGTRLWPLSRALHPKQYLSLGIGGTERTLFQQAALRVAALAGAGIAVQRALHRRQRRASLHRRRPAARRGLEPPRVLLEPVGRNTAPALALAALEAAQLAGDGADPMLVVTPADHAVATRRRHSVGAAPAVRAAAAGGIVVLGIRPDRPDTGYGYIRARARRRRERWRRTASPPSSKSPTSRPPSATSPKAATTGTAACSCCAPASGWPRWSAFAPTSRGLRGRVRAPPTTDGAFLRFDARRLRRDPGREHRLRGHGAGEPRRLGHRRCSMVPLDAGWSDLGAWDAVWQVGARDGDGNAAHGDAVVRDSRNTLVHATSRLVGVIGLDDVTVVETADAVLVAHRSKSRGGQGHGRRRSAQTGRSEASTHRRVHRPWGWYESIDQGPRFQVKRILVKPGARLSLQMHHHRAEHWVVVSGTAEVTNGDAVTMLTENQSTYIPLGQTHRLANPGKVPLEIIEVQSGSYLGEDDIVRFEDNYGRS